jgi:hypothetical protein
VKCQVHESARSHTPPPIAELENVFTAYTGTTLLSFDTSKTTEPIYDFFLGGGGGCWSKAKDVGRISFFLFNTTFQCGKFLLLHVSLHAVPK